MRVGDGSRHQHIGFVRGVAKHQALVACALFMIGGLINAHCNIRGLFTECIDHRARGAIESYVRGVITHINDGFAANLFEVDVSAASYFTSKNHSGFNQGLTGDPALDLAREGIENRI